MDDGVPSLRAAALSGRMLAAATPLALGHAPSPPAPPPPACIVHGRRPKRGRPGVAGFHSAEIVVCEPPPIEATVHAGASDGHRDRSILVVEDEDILSAVGQRLQILCDAAREELTDKL
jgi:hypothetical protein